MTPSAHRLPRAYWYTTFLLFGSAIIGGGITFIFKYWDDAIVAVLNASVYVYHRPLQAFATLFAFAWLMTIVGLMYEDEI